MKKGLDYDPQLLKNMVEGLSESPTETRFMMTYLYKGAIFEIRFGNAFFHLKRDKLLCQVTFCDIFEGIDLFHKDFLKKQQYYRDANLSVHNLKDMINWERMHKAMDGLL